MECENVDVLARRERQDLPPMFGLDIKIRCRGIASKWRASPSIWLE